MDIITWLRDLELGAYEEAFLNNDIDIEVLTDLSADDLKEIGVVSVGHRRRILKAIEALQGAADQPASASALETHETTNAERRMLTVMFCDLVGSTSMSVGTDPEDLQEFISQFRKTLAESITPLGGHVAQFVGDGILAYFGYPQSSDHDAEKAVTGALAVVDAVSLMPRFADVQPAVRIGIATGLAIVGGVDRESEMKGESAVGETLNLAARLQAVAKPDQIVIASATRRLVGEMFSCQSIGHFELKGFEAPVEAWSVARSTINTSRFEALRSGGKNSAPFVGRVSELSILRNGLSAAQTGNGQFFRIVGEAGMGKSSLAQHVVQDEEGDRPGIVLQCSPYQTGTPFHPLRYFLEREVGIGVDDEAAICRSKIQDYLAKFGEVNDQRLGVVAALLGIEAMEPDPLAHFSPYQRRSLEIQHFSDLLKAIILQTLTVVVEDIQWMDPSSVELLIKIMQDLDNKCVFLVATSRPAPVPEWLDIVTATSIQLGGLSTVESKQMVQGLLGDRPALNTVIEAISDRSDGIPIFLEELTRGYIEAIDSNEEDWRLTNIPATLSESVMARLDRLINGRRVAPIAAVIGREFPISILIAVSDLQEKIVENGILELIEAGVLARGHSPFGEAVRFRQMMVRDAAYELLLRRDRRAMHAKIAETLTRDFSKISEGMPHVLAMQYQYAGNPHASLEQWERAGERAAKQSAYAEAVAHFQNALSVLSEVGDGEGLEEKELSLRLNLVGAIIAAHGYSAKGVEVEVNRITELGKSLGDNNQIVPALASRWVMLGSSGNTPASLELAFQIRDLAETGSNADKLLSWRMCGTSLLFCSRLEEAVECYKDFMELYDFNQHAEALRTIYGDHALMAQLGLAEAYMLMNQPDLAYQWRTSAIEAARASKRAHDIGHILAYAGCLHPLLMGEYEEFYAYVQEFNELISANSLPFWEGHANLFHGLAQINQGEIEAGFESARTGVRKLREANAFSNCWYILFADVCVAHNFLEEAENMLDYVRPSIEQGDKRFGPEFYRVQAVLARKRGSTDTDLITQLDQAYDMAIETGTSVFEVRLRREIEELKGSVSTRSC